MKKPSTLLRSFSSKLSSCSRARRPSVAPWPPHRSPFDRWLDSEIDDLLLLPSASAATLSKALATATAAQETAVRSMMAGNTPCRHAYLDDVLDLLDACSVVRQRIVDIRAYVNSLNIAAHWLADTDSVHVHVHAVQRAQAALCTGAALEKRCAELDTCGSSLRKLGERVSRPHESSSSSSSNNNDDDELVVEMLDGARAIALLVLGMANVALAFRTRRGVPTVVQSTGSRHSWTDTLSEMQRGAREEYEKRRRDGVAVLEELRVAVMVARRLRGVLGGENGEEMKEVVRELKRCCGKLEEGVRGLELGVEGLYKGLIEVRMCLLGASSNQGHN